MAEPTDWQQWHAAYDDPDSRLSERLRVVQSHVRAALDERAAQPGPIRITSMCAGQGRDVIGALAEHPRRARRHGGARRAGRRTGGGGARERPRGADSTA